MRRDPGTRAFTIIELLVVVAVIGVLLAVSAPALRYVSQSAVDAANLARLRQHTQVFQMYSHDYDQQYPLIMKIGQPWDFVRLGRYLVKTDYFSSYYSWAFALAAGYYEDDPYSEVFQPVESVFSAHRRVELVTPFWYSSSFLADPKFWNYSTRTGPDQWRSTRQTEVRFTSKKILFYTGDQFARYSDVSLTPAFTDGSASVVRARDLRESYRMGTGPWPGRGHLNGGIPGMHTIDGVHGRDID